MERWDPRTTPRPQTRRSIKKRVQEHFQEFKQKHHKNHTYRSTVAKHMALRKHNFDTENLKIVSYFSSLTGVEACLL